MLGLLIVGLPAAVVADCQLSSPESHSFAPGIFWEYWCSQLSGADDASYYITLHSTNMDEYTVQSVIADDSGNTGTGADLPNGPTGYWYGQVRTYHDNFAHSEYYYDDQSGGIYINVVNNVRITCVTPGYGSTCNIMIDQLRLCAGKTCQPTQALGNVTVSAQEMVSGRPTSLTGGENAGQQLRPIDEATLLI